MKRLSDAGYQVFAVGGAVRDCLLGREPHDYDLTTSATPDEMAAVFSDMRTIPTGIAHGTLTVLSDSHPIEITTFRVDGGYSDGRHPDAVSFSRNLGDDLARRDFTVNALAWSQETGFVDLFGGIADLRSGVIRAVGEPSLRFTEDALRILRAFRFSARLGFSIEKETLCAAVRLKDRLALISAERIASELCGLLCAPHPAPSLTAMKDAGILSLILGVKIPSENIYLISRLPDSARLEVRLGALLRGTAEAQKILKKLKLSNKTVAEAAEIATAQLPTEFTDSALRRFASKNGTARDILLLCEDESTLAHFDSVMAQKPPISISQLAVGGRELSESGIARGKELGEVLAHLLETVLDDPGKNTAESLLSTARRYMESKNERKI
jgi:tRNA nucleotidyltransferase (CCA-adding enzyme)